MRPSLSAYVLSLSLAAVTAAAFPVSDTIDAPTDDDGLLPRFLTGSAHQIAGPDAGSSAPRSGQ